MNLLLIASISVGVFFLSTIFVGIWQREMRLRAILDRPNSRSLHIVPTPRGGGVGIFLAYFLGILFASLSTRFFEMKDLYAFTGGILVFLVGLWDDFKNSRKRVRLLVHILSVAFAYLWIDDSLCMWLYEKGMGLKYAEWLTVSFWILGIVWSINLFNFMDGINGIAGMEAIFLAIAMAFFLYLRDPNHFRFVQMLVLGFATLGFLIWNFPKAFVFLGDSGSGFLGYSLSTLGSWMVVNSYVNLTSILVLTSLFWLDATLTVLWRLWNGKNIFEPHKTHAYQILARRWQSHKPVTILYFFLNSGVLFPCVYLAESGLLNGYLLLSIVLSVEFYLYIKIRQLEDSMYDG